MEDFRYITKDKELKDYLQHLKDLRLNSLAVDFEGEYNLHRYGEHLCLIQIFDGKEYTLIDPLNMDVSLIRDFFEDPRILKIFYDCTGDRTLLYRKYNINLSGVLDLMPAVELLDFPKKNLNAVLEQVLSIENKSSKKYQRYNWMTRPISSDALLYALEDVKYLHDL
ncbi:MAG: hypothetical protein PF447_00390 [Spirochaetaceae bacterium]|jgi:ribonuclease D|nr:hypothetical protein [Spirochaetaceae bacterium]